MKMIKRICTCLLAVLMSVAYQGVFAEEQAFSFESAYYQTVLKGLMQNYKFEADTEAIATAIAEAALQKHPELLEELINVTADQFDEHTDYLTQEELTAFTQSLDGEYVGIGISVQREKGAVKVDSVFAEGPADVAGIKAGDRFLRVNDQDVQDYSINELVQLVRGQAGTTVQLTMERNGDVLNFTVSRAAVQQNTVNYKVLEDHIGYLSISVFNGNTPTELAEADAFFKEQGIAKLVIDLRDNPGGEVLSVVNSLGYFVPQGQTVVQFDYKLKERNSSLRSVGNVKTSSGYQLAVLINEGSASAAEIFAGNIRDHGLGKLVGSRSYGKGTVQEMVGLLSTDTLSVGQIKLTTCEYVLPGGDRIHGVGLVPDIRVSNKIVPLNTDEMEQMEFGYNFKEGDSGKAILALKQRFDALGYFVGEVDNQFDRELTLSVKQFQTAYGLPATGVMDMDTETLFSSVVSAAQVLKDNQLERAVEYLKTGK